MEESDLNPILQFLQNVVLFTWNSIESTVLLLLHLSAAYFLLDQAQVLSRYKKYSIPIPDWEKTGKFLNYFIKISLLALLLLLLALEVVLSRSQLVEQERGFELWIQMSIVMPVMIIKIYSEFNHKLSVQESLAMMSIKSGTMHLVVLVSREITLLVTGIARLGIGNAEASSSNWATLGLTFLRFLATCGLLYFTLAQSNNFQTDTKPSAAALDDAKDAKNEKSDEADKKKHLGPYEIWAQFYAFRVYFIPTELLARVAFFVFVSMIAVDSFIDLYTNITYRRIMDSLHLSTASPGTSPSNDTDILPSAPAVGAIKLEFRWDYLVIYAVLKFSQYNIVGNIKYYLKSQVQKSCCCQLQMDLFSKLHKLSLRWHLENKSLEVFSMMTSAPSILTDVLSSLCWLAPSCLNMVVAVVYLLSAYSFKLSGIVVCTAIVSVTLDVLVLKWRDKALKEMDEAEKETRAARANSFENYETVKYFTNEAYEKDMYEKQYLEEQQQNMKVVSRYDISSIVREFLQGIAELGVILIVVRSIVNEDGLTAGDYIYFSSIFSKVMDPVESLMRFYGGLQENAIDLEKVMNVLTLVPEIIDEPDALPLELDETGGSIEFRNVDFSYTPDRQILSNVNFTIPAGKTVAFVGHSGCGKSTVAKLLFRFYDPSAGEILIDGKNIRKVQCHSLRKLIGVVPQDIVLFDDTIKENIRYGNILSATDEDVIEASKLASLHERIETFPDKYETEVGSRGLKLSGGEKQRVAIARTIVKNPPIVILDEATSSLDTETERQIQSSLKTLCENRTCLIIAHRLSTIVHADQIVVLKDGHVTESGTHDQLLTKEGAYAHMWNQQFNSAEDGARKIHRNKSDLPDLNSNSFRVRRRRQIYSSRMQQTVWSLLDRKALTMDRC